MQIAKKSLENCMSQDAIRKWTRGWTGHVLHNFHWFGIPIFFMCWFFCDPNDNAATLSALLQDCMLTFASVSNLVLMEIQISFHMACSMPLYPLGRKKKGKKLRNGLLGLQPAQESWFCLPAHSCLHRREQSRGKFRHRNPELLYLSLLPPNMKGWKHKRRLGFHYLYSK